MKYVFTTLLYVLTHGSHASNLNQYERYASLSNFDGSRFYAAASNCDYDTLWTWANRCCAQATNDALFSNASNSLPHWPRPEIYTESACAYRWEVPSGTGIKPDLVIYQENCSKNYSKSLGGSSFHIIARGDFLGQCEIRDLFDNSYHVFCHVSSEKCFNVSITLDFEHFDAYAELGALFGRQYNPLRLKLADILVCRESGRSAKLNKIWRKDYQTSLYAWNSSAPLIESKKKWCFEDRRVIFIGESHMRYNWDLIVSNLPTENNILKTLSRHHGDATVAGGNFSFKEAIYARGFVDPFINLCNQSLVDPRPYTVVFQPGSWDSTMWPPQQFISNPHGGALTLLHTIQEFATTKCDVHIRLVWVQQVPYPEENCVGLCSTTRLARNNFAISAMNEFLHRELLKIGYPDLRIVRAYDIIMPRNGEFICNNHFLCHPDNSLSVWQTPAGYAVAREIAHEIC